MSQQNKFDAFISYSRSTDLTLARAIQSGLQRLGAPWYRVRNLRVFRDEEDLSANPSLWGTLEKHLDNSCWLILLASPTAAASPWVSEEVRYWVETYGTDSLLIALADGKIAWEEEAQDFDWAKTTALPAVLKRRFEQEPTWVDFSHIDADDQPSLRHPDFLNAIAKIVAPIRGVDLKTLVSAEQREYRRRLRLAWTTIVLLACLAVTALGFALYARSEAYEKTKQYKRAEAEKVKKTYEYNRAEAARKKAVAAELKTRQELSRSLMQRGAATLSRGQWRQGIALLARSLREDETNMSARRLLYASLTQRQLPGRVASIRSPARVLYAHVDPRRQRLIALGRDGKGRIYDLRTEALVSETSIYEPLATDGPFVFAKAFGNADGSIVGVVNDTVLILWHTDRNEKRVLALSDDPGTRMLAQWYEGNLKVSLKELMKFKGRFKNTGPLTNNSEGKLPAVVALTLMNEFAKRWQAFGLHEESVTVLKNRAVILHRFGVTEVDLNTLKQLSFVAGKRTGKISRDGKLWIDAGRHTIRIHDLDKNQPRQPIPQPGPTQISFPSHKGRYIASASNKFGEIWIIDTKTNESMSVKVPSESRMLAAFFSPRNTHVLAGFEDGKTYLINLLLTPLRAIPLNASENLTCACFNDSGNLVAVGDVKGNVRIWDLKSRELIGEPIQLPDWVSALQFKDGGRLLVSVAGGTVTVWDLRNSRALWQTLHRRDMGNAKLWALTPDPKQRQARMLSPFFHSRLFSGSALNHVMSSMNPDVPGIRSVAVSIQGDRLGLAFQNGYVALWDVQAKPKLLGRHKGPSIATAIAFRNDGNEIAIGYANGQVQTINCATMMGTQSWQASHLPVHDLVFGGNPAYVVALCSNRRAGLFPDPERLPISLPLVFDRQMANIIQSMPWDTLGPKTEFQLVIRHRDSKKTHELFDKNSDFGVLDDPLPYPRWPASLNLSPNGRYLAVCALIGQFEVWDLTTVNRMWRGDVGEQRIHDAVFDPQSQHLILASSGPQISIWDAATGKASSTLTGHSQGVSQLAFSNRGRYLVSSSLDSTVRVWDWHNRKVTKVFHEAGPVRQAELCEETGLLTCLLDVEGTDTRNRSTSVWSLKDEFRLSGPLRHPLGMDFVKLSTNGNWLISGVRGGGVYSWALQDPRIASPELAHVAELLVEQQVDKKGNLVFIKKENAKTARLSNPAVWFLADRFQRTTSPQSRTSIYDWIATQYPLLQNGLRDSEILARTLPTHPLVQSRLAAYYGNYDKSYARQLFDAATATTEKTDHGLLEQALYQLLDGKLDKAKHLLDQAKNLADTNNHRFLSAVYQGCQGNTDAALRHCEQILKAKKPTNPYLLLGVADVMKVNQKTVEAQRIVKQALRLRPDDTSFQLAAAWRLLAMNATDDARQLFMKCTSDDFDGFKEQAGLGLAIALWQQGKKHEAALIYQKLRLPAEGAFQQQVQLCGNYARQYQVEMKHLHKRLRSGGVEIDLTAAATGIEGTLTKDHPKDVFSQTKNSYHQVYTVDLKANVQYQFDVQGKFDTFLRLEDLKGRLLVLNDDMSPTNLNSRFVYLALENAKCRVVVTSYAPEQTGAYTLKVQDVVQEGKTQIQKGKLAKSDIKRGGKFTNLVRLSLKKGIPHVIEVSSTDFQPITVLSNPSAIKRSILGFQPDRGTTAVSRIHITPNSNGVHYLLITSDRPGQIGSYAIQVQRFRPAEYSEP